MAKKNEEKTREYYMAECDRLRNKLKNCENRKFENEVYSLRRQVKALKEERDRNYIPLPKTNTEKVSKASIKKETYFQLKKQYNEEIAKTSRLSSIVHKLQTERLNIDKYYKTIIDEIERSYKIDTKRVEFLETSLVEIDEFLKKRLTNAFNMEYKNILLFEDQDKISMKTLLLDLVNVFLSLKLFEMHLFDYIIARQDPDEKTEYDTIILIKQCAAYSKELYDLVKNEKQLNFEKYEKLIRKFVKENIWKRTI